ncbi:MAG TPA: hypothetical protein VD978_05670 [Azospirillum sp.]|nr:hypothetical protein [Azospirillum sp.]
MDTDTRELAEALRDAEDRLRYYRRCMPELVGMTEDGYAGTDEARRTDAALKRAVKALRRVGLEPINGP